MVSAPKAKKPCYFSVARFPCVLEEREGFEPSIQHNCISDFESDNTSIHQHSEVLIESIQINNLRGFSQKVSAPSVD